MTAYTGGMPSFSTGEKTGVSAKLNQVRDLGRAFTDAWTFVTPTITGWTLGNGTIGAKWAQAGKFVAFRAALTVGSTTTIGATLEFSVPVAAKDTLPHASTLAVLEDVGGAWYQAGSLLDVGAGKLLVRMLGTNGRMDNLGAASPFTWGSGDRVYVSALYEAA